MVSAPHDHQQQKTPPTRKGQQTRGRIVQAAAALMLKSGVGRTTLDEVIEAAGVGKSQLYHYFTGKDDLVEAVIAYQTAQVLSPKGPHLAPLDSWEAWQQWRDAVVGLQAGAGCIGGCPLGSLASEPNGHPPIQPAPAWSRTTASRHCCQASQLSSGARCGPAGLST